jgi:hypothetical protein
MTEAIWWAYAAAAIAVFGYCFYRFGIPGHNGEQ